MVSQDLRVCSIFRRKSWGGGGTGVGVDNSRCKLPPFNLRVHFGLHRGISEVRLYVCDYELDNPYQI